MEGDHQNARFGSLDEGSLAERLRPWNNWEGISACDVWQDWDRDIPRTLLGVAVRDGCVLSTFSLYAVESGLRWASLSSNNGWSANLEDFAMKKTYFWSASTTSLFAARPIVEAWSRLGPLMVVGWGVEGKSGRCWLSLESKEQREVAMPAIDKNR